MGYLAGDLGTRTGGRCVTLVEAHTANPRKPQPPLHMEREYVKKRTDYQLDKEITILVPAGGKKDLGVYQHKELFPDHYLVSANKSNVKRLLKEFYPEQYDYEFVDDSLLIEILETEVYIAKEIPERKTLKNLPF